MLDKDVSIIHITEEPAMREQVEIVETDVEGIYEVEGLTDQEADDIVSNYSAKFASK